MTKARRLVAVLTLVGTAAIVSSFTLGQSPGNKAKAPGAASPQLNSGAASASADATPAERFTADGVLTYQPVKGDLLFALQVKHDLKPERRLPRDYVVLMSGSAAMSGSGWIGARQIVEGLIGTSADATKNPDAQRDSMSVWLVGDKARTRSITNGFLTPGDDVERKRLEAYVRGLKEKEYPTGADDLRSAVEQALGTFPDKAGRQQIMVYLGNGQSLLNPMSGADRQALADKLVAKRVAFFPVPLGMGLTPDNLHGLATATGGAVLRTLVEAEKLTVALDRYEAAFAGTILYAPKLQLPADVVESFPNTLPPLRADAATLVIGKMKAANDFNYTITGVVAGREGQLTVARSDKIRAVDLENYFLISMVQQWRKAPERPAMLRADRTLAIAYENTRLKHRDLLDSAYLAMEKNEFAAAARLFDEVRTLAPSDNEAEAGIKVVDKLRSGKLTAEVLRQSMAKSGQKGDVIQTDKATGKPRWNKGDLINFVTVQEEKEKKGPGGKEPGGVANPNPGLEQDLLQAHRDRVVIEEQKMRQAVEAAIQLSRKDLANDPDGVLEVLRGLLGRVKDHPDLGEKERDALLSRLNVSLKESAGAARDIKLRREFAANEAAQSKANLEKIKQSQTFQDRLEAQFRAYRDVIAQARTDTAAMQDLTKGMVDILNEANQKGQALPQTAQAMYTQAQASYQLHQLDVLRRRREEGFLAVILAIEKSHVPYPDEPGIYFPPLATWKAIEKLRKDKYETSSLPNDDTGRKEAKAVEKMLDDVIETKDFTNPMTLKDALQLFYEKFAAKGKELPILVDVQAFKTEDEAAPSPYDAQVQLQPVPKQMTMGTALRLILSQVTTNNATYVIRRNFIEITTNDRALADKVLRVYPVGDLVIPISQPLQGLGGQGGAGGFGGQFGQGGGFGGQFGQGGFGGGGQFGQFGQFGQGGGGFGGQFGQGGFGGGGFGGQFGQGGFGGQFGQGGFGGGGFGGGVGGFGGGGQFQGGAFQGGFNGSLGALGASQAYGLIQLITRVVDPGRWFYTMQPNPFMNGNFGMGGMFGMFGMGGNFGMFGMMGGMFGNPFGMMGGNPFNMAGMMGMMGQPPPPGEGGPADLRTANTIEFFPPALALIIRAPSRVHYSPFGGIVGGKGGKAPEAAAWAELTGKDLIAGRDKNKKPAVAGNQENIVARNIDVDATKVWEDALAQGSVEPGMVVATADFLFQYGYLTHAVEFLKANLRHGIVVRPWVYEAMAIAMEASGGDPEEIRRARLSAVALDPNDAQGFLRAAQTLADNKEYDKALSFCRQAAQIEPNLAVSYRDALAYADLGKDARAMEWAVSNIVAQDWPTDNIGLHKKAEVHVSTLTEALVKDKRADDATKLKAVLQQFRQRDLIVKLSWDNPDARNLSEVEMTIKEPTGSICSSKQTQTTGGGTMITCDMFDKGKAKDQAGIAMPPTFAVNYTAGQGFSGDYEITVRRLWGQPASNRARLEIVMHAGTPQEKRRIEAVDVTFGKTVKVTLKNGRRTELASISPANEVKRQETVSADEPTNPWLKLRQLAHPYFAGGKSAVAGGSSTPGAAHIMALAKPRNGKRLAVTDAPVLQQTAIKGSGVNMNGQVRQSEDGRGFEMVMQPIFQAMTGGSRSKSNLDVIPGGN